MRYMPGSGEVTIPPDASDVVKSILSDNQITVTVNKTTQILLYPLLGPLMS